MRYEVWYSWQFAPDVICGCLSCDLCVWVECLDGDSSMHVNWVMLSSLRFYEARMLVEVPWCFPFTGHLQLNGNLQKFETLSWDSPMSYHLLERRNAECNWCRVRLWHVGQEGWQTFCLVGHCCQMTSDIANSSFRLFSVKA
jgi:hypothetical protein